VMLALAHPALLWSGLGLIAVPVLIHLFFRRRHRVVRWAAMEFLLAALRKQKRRVEIENLILLLLRCAMILLLALAIARPAVQAAALNPFGGGSRRVVLLMDTSASMGARSTGRRALDRAKERAVRILADLPSGSSVTLVVTRDDLMGGAPRALLENASPEEARGRLATLHLSHGPNRLGEVFRLVGNKLERLQGRKLVIFVTDLQKRDWRDDKGGRREDVYRALRGLRREGDDEAPPVTVLDVGMPEAANVAVTDFTIDSGREAIVDTLVGLTVTLVNYGSRAANGTLTLYVARPLEGTWEKQPSIGVRVEPTIGVGAPTPFVQQLYHDLSGLPEGPLRLRIAFEAATGGTDRVPGDSERFLALRIKPPVRFLPVRNFTGAFDVLRDVQVEEVIQFDEAVYPEDLDNYDLGRTDVVVWGDAEIHSLSPPGVKNLEQFVRRGGAFLCYLGRSAVADRVNELFFKEGYAGLFPMLLKQDGWREDEEHPVQLVVEEEDPRALFEEAKVFGSPEFLGYWQIREAKPGSVLAQYTTDEPAVLAHTFGRGRVLVCTTGPDERTFRLNGSLLPAIFFFNAAHYLVAEDTADRNVLVGMPVKVPLPPGARQVLVDPPAEAGGRLDEPIADATKPFILQNTAFPGFYRMTVRGVTTRGASALPIEERHVAAVNRDADEGDLRRLDPDELLRTYQGTRLHFTADVEAIFPRVASGDTGDVSRGLLGGVVVMLFLELLLAWRFGARRREPR